MSRGRGKNIRIFTPQGRYQDLADYRVHGLQMLDALVKDFPLLAVKSKVKSNKEGRIVALEYEKKWLETLPSDWRFGNRKYNLIVPEDDRAWLDLAITDSKGNFWPVNVKVGKSGTSTDNIGGKKIIEYLLLADDVDAKTLKFKHPYGALKTEQQLAAQVAQLQMSPLLRPVSMREYFLLHYSHVSEKTKILPLSAIEAEQIRVNPKNGFQIAMSRAEFDPTIDMEASWQKIADRYYQYLLAMAAPAKAFEKIVDNKD